MKCAVVYFSQTGSTKKMAEHIKQGIEQTGSTCDICRVEDADPRKLYSYDLIGIGSAVHGGQLPRIGPFIDGLRGVGGKHFFLFSTHGVSPEGFFPLMYERLKPSGVVVIGTEHWYANVNLLHMLDPYPTNGHPDEIDLREAEAFGREMVERSRKISAGETGLIPPIEVIDTSSLPVPPDGGGPGARYTALLKHDKDKCNYPHCRLCMENCPVDGIDLSLDPPMLAQNCAGCEFCTKICPTGAMNADEWLVGTVDIVSKMIHSHLLPALEKAEAEGKFRRAIPVSELRLDTYGYMAHQTHPQWIIGKGWNPQG